MLKVGDKVKVVEDIVKAGISGRYLNKQGTIVNLKQNKNIKTNLNVEVDFGDLTWGYFSEEELERLDA